MGPDPSVSLDKKVMCYLIVVRIVFNFKQSKPSSQVYLKSKIIQTIKIINYKWLKIL